jgi:nucleoside-diphosphate-sugar epimerase
MKKCLITGATGLIGRHVVGLLGDDWELYALVRKAEHSPSHRTHYIKCDLAEECIAERLPTTVDALIHLAQSEHFREFPMHAEPIFKVNVVSTLRLLIYSLHARVKTFVLASSGGIYGHGDEGFTEEDPIPTKDSLGFYLGTKLCAEVLAENYTPYMNVIILRFFFVYGSGQRPSMLIPRLVKAVKEGQPVILHGKDGLKMNPTYVTDAASAVCRSLELTESQKINIGGPEVLSLRQIGQQVGKVLHKDPVFEVKEYIPPQHLVGDIKKMNHLLGRPVVKFEEGIAKYIEEQHEE